MQDFLKSTIKEAGKIAVDYFNKGVTHKQKKHLADLVTEADIAVSDFLIDIIHTKYPDHAIHTEEEGDDINPGAQFEWVIDPIDGTRNFAMGISFWCVMVAILKDGELYMSAVYNPLADELFFAEVGKGAYMNDKRISVNKVDSLEHSFGIVMRGVNTDCEEDYRKMVAKVSTDTSMWMMNFGTMLSFCHVSMGGGADLFAVNCGFDHDYLPGVLIALEAGAVVTDSKGGEWTRYKRDIVVANPNLHPKILELFNN